MRLSEKTKERLSIMIFVFVISVVLVLGLFPNRGTAMQSTKTYNEWYSEWIWSLSDMANISR